MRVITAPEPVPMDGRQIFLAGAIDMGAAVDWQAIVINAFQGCDVTLINPRRAEFTPDTLDEQVIWELWALRRANLILMWFPKDSKAPISFLEAGLYWRSDKLVIGAEPEFYRRRNLELTAGVYGGPTIHDNLASLIISAKRMVGVGEPARITGHLTDPIVRSELTNFED